MTMLKRTTRTHLLAQLLEVVSRKVTKMGLLRKAMTLTITGIQKHDLLGSAIVNLDPT
jgi:hypothetical protein